MGYMMLIAECGGCGKMVICNPTKVPSVENQPLCQGCVEYVNKLKVEAGLEPVRISKDAYIEEA